MQAIMQKLGPSATDVIRADHTRVTAVFHRYKPESPPALKRAIAGKICLALEVHAQMEEEIFYPAMRSVGSRVVDEISPEHEAIRRLIADLRTMDAASPQYDWTFMELMRTVIHHVADEETTLLPSAEQVLGARLGELGTRMAKRRMQLMAGRTRELVRYRTSTMSKATPVLAAAAALLGGFLLARRLRRAG